MTSVQLLRELSRRKGFTAERSKAFADGADAIEFKGWLFERASFGDGPLRFHLIWDQWSGRGDFLSHCEAQWRASRGL